MKNDYSLDRKILELADLAGAIGSRDKNFNAVAVEGEYDAIDMAAGQVLKGVGEFSGELKEVEDDWTLTQVYTIKDALMTMLYLSRSNGNMKDKIEAKVLINLIFKLIKKQMMTYPVRGDDYEIGSLLVLAGLEGHIKTMERTVDIYNDELVDEVLQGEVKSLIRELFRIRSQGKKFVVDDNKPSRKNRDDLLMQIKKLHIRLEALSGHFVKSENLNNNQ